MILDSQMQLSDAQAFSATAVTTNAYDTALAGNDVTVGEPLVMVVVVTTAADSTTGDETYSFDVIESASSNLGSATVLARRTIAAASLTAGSIHYVPVPQKSKALRYLGGQATLGGTSPSVTCDIYFQPASMIQADKYYADGLTITH